jgi:hypothetical protein
MWYQLKVDLLVAAFVFGIAGLLIAALFVYQEAKAYAAARHRIYQRLATLVSQPQVFANSFAISRSFSRSHSRQHGASPKFQ